MSRVFKRCCKGQQSLIRPSLMVGFASSAPGPLAPRYFGRRVHKKSPAETRRLLLGLVGTGVRAANQAASVVRAASVPTHADRTLVGPNGRSVLIARLVLMTCRLVLMMTCRLVLMRTCGLIT